MVINCLRAPGCFNLSRFGDGAGKGTVVAIWVMYRLRGITNNNNNNNFNLMSEKPLVPGHPKFSQLDSKIRCKDLNAI